MARPIRRRVTRALAGLAAGRAAVLAVASRAVRWGAWFPVFRNPTAVRATRALAGYAAGKAQAMTSLTIHMGTPEGTVLSVSPGITAAQFAAAIANTSYDVIEMAAGDYGYLRSAGVIVTADRTSRPVTVRPAAGETVEFNCAGDGDYGGPVFQFNSGAAHITFDGSPGLFYFRHILLAAQGIVQTSGAHAIAFSNVMVRNVAGNTHTTEQSSHCVYVSTDSHDLTFNDWDVDLLRASDEPGGLYGASGLQIYLGGATPASYNITARRWTIAHANWATIVGSSPAATGLVYSEWSVNSCGASVPAAMEWQTSSTGTVTNCVTTNSIGTPHIMGGMTDGGGNSWA